VNKVLTQDDFNQSLSSAGMTSAKPGRAESFDAYFKQDLQQWSQIVKAANITPESPATGESIDETHATQHTPHHG